MPVIEFVGQSVQDATSVASNPSRLLNCYREPVLSEGRTGFILKSVLGQDAKDDIGTDPIRAMGRGNGKNWLIGDEKLYEIASDGQVTQRGGAIADGANATIAGNQSDVTFTVGNKYYVWDGANITEPTTKTFTNVGSHCFVKGYTVLTETDGRRFQWSALGDAGTLDALHFASADAVDDNIVRAVEFAGNLLLMCETSTEIWQNVPGGTGTGAFSFVRATNTGLKSFNLLVRFDDALAFVGNDNRVYLFGQGVISTPVVDTNVANGTPTHMFYYEDGGHKFIVLRFADRPAWVFDMTTGEWHERSEGAGHLRWRATCSVRNGAGWLVGNTDGEVLSLARVPRDLAGPLYRRVIGRTLYLGDRKFTVPFVEVLARVGDYDISQAQQYAWGVGGGAAWQVESGFVWLIESVPTDIEREPVIELYESGDGGRTWRGPKPRNLGKLGEFDQRMTWWSRGQFQQYTIRFDWSDPADITLYASAVVRAA